MATTNSYDLSCGNDEPDRASISIGDGVQLGVHTTFGAPDLAPTPPFFHLDTRRRALCLEVGRIDHDCLVLGTLSGQAPVIAPELPAVLKSLVSAVYLRRVVPSQAVAVDEDYSPYEATVIDAVLGVARWEERVQALHLGVAQRVETAYQSGLLAEPEPCQASETNWLEAQANRLLTIINRTNKNHALIFTERHGRQAENCRNGQSDGTTTRLLWLKPQTRLTGTSEWLPSCERRDA